MRFARWSAALLVLLASTGAYAEGLVDSLVRRFAESDFQFIRGQTNAPFLPLAWATATNYRQGEFTRPDGSTADRPFEQTSFSEGAFLPVPIGRRDAFVVGEWVGKTKFRAKGDVGRDLDVLSAALPVGWARQLKPDWQLAGFVAPLGHHNDDDWYWETLGGIFARRTPNERVAWVFGFYFDVSSLEDFYTPYVGATWIIDERWSLNAILPWPGITYAPSTRTLFRLSIAPSGTSWSLEAGTDRPRVSFSAWNLGLAAERRIAHQIWVGVEAGVSGLRGLSIIGGDWESPDTQLDPTSYALLTISFRPVTGPDR